MITVLVIGERERAEDLDRIASRNPSLELLHATGLEEALDRLARNRRIDAVLLMVDAAAGRELAATVLDEDPGAPPMFTPSGPHMPGVRTLAASSPAELLELIARELIP